MPNINQLESLDAFRAVVECGSFSGAARELKVSTSWISKRIDRLETLLQTKLLNRNTRHVGLTLNGAICYNRALEVLELWNNLSCEISTTDTALEGQIRISAPMSWGLIQLSPLINRFSKIYPGVSFDLVLSDQHVNIVAENFDVALRIAERLEDSSLLARKIRSYRRVLCASPDLILRMGHPNCLDELNDFYPLVFSMNGKLVKWKFFQNENMHQIDIKPFVCCNNSLLLKSHSVAGDGVALVPEFLVHQELKDGVLVELLKDYTASSLNLYSLRPGGKAPTKRLSVFLDFIHQEL